jgi:hypothetical protein
MLTFSEQARQLTVKASQQDVSLGQPTISGFFLQ